MNGDTYKQIMYIELNLYSSVIHVFNGLSQFMTTNYTYLPLLCNEDVISFYMNIMLSGLELVLKLRYFGYYDFTIFCEVDKIYTKTVYWLTTFPKSTQIL